MRAVKDSAPSDRARGYAAVGLVRPKTPANFGSVLRASHVYGAALVVASGERGQRTTQLVRSHTDTTKAWRHIPVVCVDDVLDATPFDAVPIAVDLIPGAKPLYTFHHPERAFYVFGPEDGTLGRSVHERCAHVVYVPGAYCMNLAACVNVVLYDRACKRSLRSDALACGGVR